MKRFTLSTWNRTLADYPTDAINDGRLYAFAESDKLDLDAFKAEMDAFKADPTKWEPYLGEESFPANSEGMAFCITDCLPLPAQQVAVCWWNIAINTWDFSK